MDFYDKLLTDTLRRHFDFCIKYKRYRDGFFLSSSKKIDFVTLKIQEILSEKKYKNKIEMIKRNRFNTLLAFKNGSTMDVYSIQPCSRGHKHNGGIIDLAIDNEAVGMIINPMFCKRQRYYPIIIQKIAAKLKIYLPYSIKDDNYNERTDYITVKGEI